MGNLRIASFDNRWASARSLKTSFISVMPGQIPSRSALKWSSAPDFSTLLVSFLTPFPSIVKEQVTLLSLPMKHSPLSASVKSFWRGTPTGSEWVLALPAPLMDLNDSAPRDDHGKAWHSHWVYIPATLHRFLQTRKCRIQRRQWTERWRTWRWLIITKYCAPGSLCLKSRSNGTDVFLMLWCPCFDNISMPCFHYFVCGVAVFRTPMSPSLRSIINVLRKRWDKCCAVNKWNHESFLYL